MKSSSPAAEVMTSLSNLIKASAYVPLSMVKRLETAPQPAPGDAGGPGGSGGSGVDADRLRRIILEKARAEAEALVDGAKTQAARLLEDARREADAWWEERRGEDDRFRAEIFEAARAEGFEQGRLEAERQVREQYEGMIREARAVLEQAHETARRIVAESEPFLLELACAIAGKIVGRRLDEKPDWIKDLVREALKRSAGKDTITLCVAPSQFSYIQSVRDDLASVIDAQAELVIVPDHSVRDHGCVVKTAFGTVDARVDTQLSEIRQALLDACMREDAHGE